MLLFGTQAHAQATQTLVINGQTVSKAVTRITFEGDNVVLHFDDETTTASDMSEITLGFSYVPTAIYTLSEAVGDQLHIAGLEPGADVEVYNAAGKKMLTVRASETSQLLSAKSLKRGVYVLRAGNKIVKFVKR